MTNSFDFVVVGAGIAGASIAAEIALHGRTLVLEAEDTPGYHATGRSAAFWEECYGGPEIVPLTLASGPWLRDGGFLANRGALYLAREADETAVEEFFIRFADTGAEFSRVGPDDLAELVPGISEDWDRGIRQRACADIDVAALHAHYLAEAKRGGAQLLCRARLASAKRVDGRWKLLLADGREIAAGVLVDAAGAWADEVAAMAGAKPLGIQPLRRTVVQLRVDPAPPQEMPLCLDISGGFYFKPENGRLWLSPHDETPSEAVDAAPEEYDVALAIDRLQGVTDWRIEAVERKWAGLRSFAPDRLPVYGFDPVVEGLFWFAGQGGYGIQTSPAAARLASQILLDLPADDMTRKIDRETYSPARFS